MTQLYIFHRLVKNSVNQGYLFSELNSKQPKSVMHKKMPILEHTVSDLTPTLPIFPSKYDVVPCNFDNCKDSCI